MPGTEPSSASAKKMTTLKRFHEAFGTNPTREAIAQAIATFERTVLNGNSLHNRADRAMRLRVSEEEGTDFTIKAKDYEKVLKEAIAKKDTVALTALGVNPARMQARRAPWPRRSARAEPLFRQGPLLAVPRRRQLHRQQFPQPGRGRGQEWQTAPRRPGPIRPDAARPQGPRDGGRVQDADAARPGRHHAAHARRQRKTLEAVIDFYDRGGNANEYLDSKMRDIEAEKAYIRSKLDGTPYKGPEVSLFGPDQKPIVPSRLNLTPAEKSALAFASLEGEVDAIVTGPAAPIPGR